MLLLDTLAELAAHARSVNADRLRRRALAVAQLADKARSAPLHKMWHCRTPQLPPNAPQLVYLAFAACSMLHMRSR